MYSSAPGAVPWQSNGAMNHHNGYPAYIPVPTRNNYMSQPGLPPPPPPPPPYNMAPVVAQNGASTQSPLPANVAPIVGQPSQARKKTEWPPDVRDYVQRCFAPNFQIPGIGKPDIEAKLKQVITDAAQRNQLQTLNWKDMPLPQHMIQEERNRAILAPQIPPPYFPGVPVSMPTGNPYPFPTPLVHKRKSSELQTGPEDSAQPPWRTAKESKLEDRVTFSPKADKRSKMDLGKLTSKSDINLEQRKRRFEDMRNGNSTHSGVGHNALMLSAKEPVGPVVGTSQKLEKNYFRLTAAPNPNDVRPLEVLRKTLELLKQKWRTDSNYVYICDQFKSLRQDLTVQHIKNDFTTSVYEIHARIALEKGDLGEYNQCQTQLRALYKQNLGGHPSEFVAYRILYLIHTCNRTDMNDVLSDLTPADKVEPAVQHALDVRSALALGNYHKFFKLYLTVPNMGGYLMDMFIERERLAAMSRISKAYKPDLRLRFITEELGFESDEDTARFMLDHDAGALLLEKDDHVRLLTGKAGPLFENARQAAFRHVDIKGQI